MAICRAEKARRKLSKPSLVTKHGWREIKRFHHRRPERESGSAFVDGEAAGSLGCGLRDERAPGWIVLDADPRAGGVACLPMVTATVR